MDMHHWPIMYLEGIISIDFLLLFVGNVYTPEGSSCLRLILRRPENIFLKQNVACV